MAALLGGGCGQRLASAAGIALAAMCVLVSRGALAKEPAFSAVAQPPLVNSQPSRPDFVRPYGAIEFGLGVLALPDAEVCSEAGCDRGDVSLEVDAWPLFRARPWLAVGAGITLGLTPAQDVPQGDVLVRRDHSRRYFMVEGVGRYYFLHSREIELWGGASAGLVVVSDNFSSPGGGSGSVLGANSANIATEGLTLGVAVGGSTALNSYLQLGGTLRVANWFLPSTKEVLPFGEEASLANRVTMLHLGVTIAYHAR